MSDDAQQLLEKALRLSVPERAELASQLLASVEQDATDEEWEAAWGKEIERRLAGDPSLDRPWEEVRAEISAKYGYK